MKRSILLLSTGLLALLATLLPYAQVEAAPRCFPEVAPTIKDCIDGRILSFWERQGGLPVFGYPLTPAYNEQTEAGTFMVQLFERVRLELHPENTPPYDVLLGHLGAGSPAFQRLPPAPPDQSRPGCLFFRETAQNLCQPFLSTWQRYGLDMGQPGVTYAESLALFGLPLGPPQSAILSDGQTYTVQWFERARFEDHGASGVMLGLLGSESAGQGTVSAIAPGAPSERGGFLQVSGSQLTRLGRPVQLKGVNYYPQWRPWAEMWKYWDGVQVERELRAARDQLGINTVRVLLPYAIASDGRDAGKVTPELLHSLREMVQIAGNLDMRVIVTLFDFYNDFPPPGSREEERNIAYLRTLIGNFVGDDRIIGWDLHNEPDHYETWKKGNSAQVLTWLGRMADEIHQIAPNHLVTVGMGQYQNLWLQAPDGRSALDLSDVISLHNYNAADTIRQIDEVRTHTSKPIILGEFGWPTGPECVVREYTENQQEWVYQEALRQAQGRVAGVVAWTLRDFDPALSIRYETREEHYGLYRIDGTLKPAAVAFQAYQAPALPSLVATSLELTRSPLRLPGGDNAPILIASTGKYIKGPIRRAWEMIGGQSSFGLPISDAFLRDPRPGEKGPMVVQYFEAGVLEMLLGTSISPEFPPQVQIDLIRQNIRPLTIGQNYLAASGIPVGRSSVAAPFDDFYRAYRGQWRFGAAISEAHTEEINGRLTTVQYFERGRLELNPDNGLVEAGRLGRWSFEQLCRS